MNNEKEIYAIYGLIDSLQIWHDVYAECITMGHDWNKKLVCEYLVNEQGFDFESFRMFIISSNFIE